MSNNWKENRLIDRKDLKILRGKFINLRLIQIGDASITFKWRRSNQAKYLNIGANTVEEQQQWIISRPSNELNYIIETKKEIPVGMISLINIDFINKTVEPGRFLIGEKDEIKSIPAAFEALLLIYKLAFKKLKLLRVYGAIAEENINMIKFQKYFGLVEEGRLRKHYYINGHSQDAICFGLLANEFHEVVLVRLDRMINILSKKINRNQ